MSKTRKIVLGIIICMLVLYAAFVFILQEANPIDWIQADRFLFACLFICCGGMTAAKIADEN